MLHRLFLALLAACLSLPALAMPMGHGAPVESVANQSGEHDCHKPAKPASERRDHAQKHECIGCIARYDGIAAPEPATLAIEPLLAGQFAMQLPQTRAGPDTPPPRS